MNQDSLNNTNGANINGSVTSENSMNNSENNIYDLSNSTMTSNSVNNSESVNTPSFDDEKEEVIYDLSSASLSSEVGVSVDKIVDTSSFNQVDDSFVPEPTLVIDDVNHEEIGKVVDKIITNPTIEEQIPQATLVIEDNGEAHSKSDDLVIAGMDRNINTKKKVIVSKPEDDIVPENVEEDLLKAYIGNNYDKMMGSSYSIPALVFSYFYVLYRKMFILPFVSFVVCTILVYITDLLFIYLLPCLLFAFVFKPLYIKKAKNYVSKTKKKMDGKKYSIVKMNCVNDGGTSLSFCLIGVVFFLVIILGFSFLLVKKGDDSIFTDIFDIIGLDVSYLDQTLKPEVQTNNIYSGVLMEDMDVKIKDEFKIDIYGKFNNDSSDSSYYYNYNSGEGIYDKCEFRFFSPIGYVDGNDLSFQMKTFYEDNHSSDVERFLVNNIKWNKFYYSNSYGLTYVYITNKDGKVYILEYLIQESADIDCSSYNDEILNNISEK